MTGEQITWNQYRTEASNIIQSFVKSPIRLEIALFSDNNRIFLNKVQKNLDKLVKDTID